MSGIALSKKHGLNPSMEVCARCGQETNAIVLLGATSKYRCSKCKGFFYGSRQKYLKGGCPLCGYHHGYPELVGNQAEAPRHITTGNLCDPCKKEEAEFTREVKAGGIRWRCDQCHNSGVIKADSLYVQHLRKEKSEVDWDHVGINMPPDDCPVCRQTPELERSTG